MMRVSVVGNCQAPGIADALSYLLPTAKVSGFDYSPVAHRNGIDAALQIISQSDYVFAHPLPEVCGALSTARLRDAVPNLRQIPVVAFTGFHPDCIPMLHDNKRVFSAMGSYNSRIVAAAYSMCLPADRVPALFNAFVYRKLGYYDEFEKARSFLYTQMESHNFDIASAWELWMGSGPFMHTINHPSSRVLASIARFLVERAGLVSQASASIVPPDFLAVNHPIWPVYPELARPLNVSGSYVFKYQTAPNLVNGSRPYINLTEFVAKSYALYEQSPMEAFQRPFIKRSAEILADAIV